MSILIAFAMAAVNLPFALDPGNGIAWLSWLTCGFCSGMGAAQIVHRVMDR